MTHETSVATPSTDRTTPSSSRARLIDTSAQRRRGPTVQSSFVVASTEDGAVLRHTALGFEVPLPEGFGPASPEATSALEPFLTHGEGHTHDEVAAYAHDDGAVLVVLCSSAISAEASWLFPFARGARPPEGEDVAVPLHMVIGFGTGGEVRQRVVSGGRVADTRALLVEAGGQSYPIEVVVVGGTEDERGRILDGIRRDP